MMAHMGKQNHIHTINAKPMLAFIARRYKVLQHRMDPTTITRQYGAFVKEHITLDPLHVDMFVDTTVIVVSPNLTAQWSKEANKVLGIAPTALTSSRRATIRIRSRSRRRQITWPKQPSFLKPASE